MVIACSFKLKLKISDVNKTKFLRPRPIFWSQTDPGLRSTVSHHITDNNNNNNNNSNNCCYIKSWLLCIDCPAGVFFMASLVAIDEQQRASSERASTNNETDWWPWISVTAVRPAAAAAAATDWRRIYLSRAARFCVCIAKLQQRYHLIRRRVNKPAASTWQLLLFWTDRPSHSYPAAICAISIWYRYVISYRLWCISGIFSITLCLRVLWRWCPMFPLVFM